LDFEPVVKLFTADGNGTWLLTELNPDIDLAFALCDLEFGEPELGYVSFAELAVARGPLSDYRANAISTSHLDGQLWNSPAAEVLMQEIG